MTNKPLPKGDYMKCILLITLLASLAHADLLVTLKDGTQAKVIGDLSKLEVVAPVVVPPPPAKVPSADKTAMPPATSIVDSGLHTWTVTGGVVSIDGAPAGTTANVTIVLYYSGVVYQGNQAGGFWKWVNGAWVATTDPRAPVVVNPPPTGNVTKGTWQSGDLPFTGISGGKFHYDYLLPFGYVATKKYPILVYEHENTEGNQWYQGKQSIWNQFEIDGAFNAIAFRTAYPAIIIVPYCDQTDNTGGTGLNFGGYNDSAGSGVNERAVVSLVQSFITNFSVDVTRIYATGDSLGGIGTAALMLDYNTVNGPKGRIFAAGLPYASQIFRTGELSQTTITRMHDVPMFAVSGRGDTTSPIEAFVRPLWRGLAGNSNYPGPQGAQAGTSKYRYLEDPNLGHDVWHTYRQLPGGKVMYDWLFAQSAGGTVTPPPVKQTPSADKTLMPPAAQIVDSASNVWTMNSGKVVLNGVTDATTANVTLMLYFGGVVYQMNQAGGFWSWQNNAWVQTTDPRGVTPPVGGQFSVKNGKFYDPKGNEFVGRGIDAGLSDMGQTTQILTLFKGINFIRFAVEESGYSDPSVYAGFVNAMTAKGVVVEIEHHVYPSPQPFTGSALQAESNWYASMAKYFINNPYVWFGTINEPGDGLAYNTAGPGISAQHLATYNAIRATGNKTILLMNYFGGGNPGSVGAGFGLTTSTYQAMTNVGWDYHFYGWISKMNTDQNVVNQSLIGSPASGSGISACQTIKSADGVMPVLIGEFGDSTDGQTVDANWQQVVSAVINSGYSYAAWHYGAYLGPHDSLTTANGALTDLGKLLAAGIAKNAPQVQATSVKTKAKVKSKPKTKN